MKKQLIIAGAMAAMLGVASCAPTIPFTGKVETVNPHILHGQVLFNQHCQKCHPGGGKGFGPQVIHRPNFVRSFQVRHGLGKMPAFKKSVISKPDLKDINAFLNYVKHVKAS